MQRARRGTTTSGTQSGGYARLVELRDYVKLGIRTRPDGERYLPLFVRLEDEIRQLEATSARLAEIRSAAIGRYRARA